MPAGEAPARPARRDPFEIAAWAAILLLCVLAAATLRDYAISNDEEVQHRYGALIIAYYASGFQDRAVFGFKNLYLYGGLFDLVAVALAKIVPYDVYIIRHALSAASGIAGIAAAGATARLLAGPRAGLLAILLLATTGAWYGAMFNHTKDIPFAAAMMAAAYWLLRVMRDLPLPRWRDALAFGLLAGVAGGLRAMGLLLAFYAAVAVAMRPPSASAGWRGTAAFAAAAMPRLLAAMALAYLVMIAAWPWASLAPLNPIRAIFAFAHFHYEIRTVLAGNVFTMADVPRWYVPAYLAIKLPLLLWSGIAIAAVIVARQAAPLPFANLRRETALLAVMAALPVASEVIADGPAFTGMRHFLFVVPPLAVLAAVGFDRALAWLAMRRHSLAVAAGSLLAVAFAWQSVLLWRLHPYEYLSYNFLVGGLPGAAGRYVMDYWVNVMPEAVRGLEAYLDAADKDARGKAGFYTVGVCAERVSFEHEADARLRWTDGWQEADFFIAPTHMGCDRAVNGKVVVRIERLGVLIGVVKDRRALHARADRDR